MADETVRQRLEFEADNAIATLKEVERQAVTVAGKAQLLNKNLQDYARALGQTWEKTFAQMKEQIGSGDDKFAGFTVSDPTTGVSADVTNQVLKQTEELARNAQAKNRFATADNNAAKAEMNFDGSVKQANIAIAEQSKRLQVLAAELNKIKSPPQGRTSTGQFTSATPPSFATQFASLTSYQQQLKLVETTIANLQRKTNLPFKDIGKELGKSFPELLEKTKLVEVAVENLTRRNQGLSASFRTEAETIKLVENRLTELQRKGALNLKGLSKQDAVDQLKSVISQVSQETGAQYKQVGDAMARMTVPAAQAQTAVRGLNRELTTGVKDANVFRHSIDLIRTALGTLAAVGIFQILSGIQSFFTEATKQARQLEETMYRLGNAERNLSLEGIEISLKGLEVGITKIQQKLPIFSREDVSQLVGSVAISTKQLGFTQEEILQLSETIALLNIQSEKSEDLATTRSHVVSALLAGNSKGISELGVTFNEAAMKEKAFELGIIEAGESLKGLSDDTKAQIKLALLHEAANLDDAESIARLNEFLDTNTAKIQANKSAWQDLLTSIGQGINNLTPDMTGFLEGLQKGFEADKVSGLFTKGIQDVIRTDGRGALELQDVGIKWKLFFRSDLAQEELDRVKEILSGLDQAEIKKVFPDPSSIKDDNLRAIVESLIEIKDTATAVPDPLLDAEVDDSGLDELSEKLQEIAIDAQHARADLAILLGQKQEDLEIDFQIKLDDLDTEYIDKAEDAAIDYGQKIEDINLDAQQKIQDAKRKARDEEEKAEAEFLMKMKHLRMDFLLDLDDALHARDARQVLRLIKEYNNDKQKLLDKKALDDQFRQESLEADLKNIEIERQRKLESAAIEYQRKLEQLAISKQREIEELNRWKQREEEELAVWYQRELEEIDRNTQQKIERLLAGYIEEGKIHEEQQAKIHGILTKWFGENKGLVDSLMAYTASAFANMAAMAAGALSFASMSLPQGQPAPYWQMASQTAGGLAAGGQFVATKPTSALFGEGGEPELVTVTPLSKLGSLRGEQPMNGMDGLDGRNGEQRIVLDMNLSPDLEARVVERAMDGTAEVIQKVNRSK